MAVGPSKKYSYSNPSISRFNVRDAVAFQHEHSSIWWPVGFQHQIELSISLFNVHDAVAFQHEHSSIWWPVGFQHQIELRNDSMLDA